MKTSTPHGVPADMLDNPEQYITKAGKLLRGHSLDEFSQIGDIFAGDSTIIGRIKKNLDFTSVSLA